MECAQGPAPRLFQTLRRRQQTLYVLGDDLRVVVAAGLGRYLEGRRPCPHFDIPPATIRTRQSMGDYLRLGVRISFTLGSLNVGMSVSVVALEQSLRDRMQKRLRPANRHRSRCRPRGIALNKLGPERSHQPVPHHNSQLCPKVRS